MSDFNCIAYDEQDTVKLGSALARHVKAGDVILLNGALATGKTYFVQSLVLALGGSATVTSPSYTIVHHYQTNTMPVIHVDTYRLNSTKEFDDLSLDSYFDSSLLLIEWGECAQAFFDCYLSINFEFAALDNFPQARHITVRGVGDAWLCVLKHLHNQFTQ